MSTIGTQLGAYYTATKQWLLAEKQHQSNQAEAYLRSQPLGSGSPDGYRVTMAMHKLSITEQQQGKESAAYGEALIGLADAYKQIGKSEQALDLYQQAVEVLEKLYDPTHQDLVKCRAEIFNLNKVQPSAD